MRHLLFLSLIAWLLALPAVADTVIKNPEFTLRIPDGFVQETPKPGMVSYAGQTPEYHDVWIELYLCTAMAQGERRDKNQVLADMPQGTTLDIGSTLWKDYDVDFELALRPNGQVSRMAWLPTNHHGLLMIATGFQEAKITVLMQTLLQNYDATVPWETNEDRDFRRAEKVGGVLAAVVLVILLVVVARKRLAG